MEDIISPPPLQISQISIPSLLDTFHTTLLILVSKYLSQTKAKNARSRAVPYLVFRGNTNSMRAALSTHTVDNKQTSLQKFS